jgi:serine/threonine-protein kinase
MEYVEGQEFAAIEVYELMKQLLAALDHAHRNGIVHCDIKPANVMVLADLKIKLMDFGVARIENSSQTQAGVTRDTPTHIAPEQYSGQRTDRRADLWAAAVILYELLTGRGPFVGQTPAAVMHQVMNVEPPPPSTLAAGLPQAFDTLLARALAKKPDERFQSARDFAKALLAAFAGHPSAGQSTRQRAVGASVTPAAKAWALPPETLAAVEAALSRAVGPFARDLVRQAAAQAKSVEEFYVQLRRKRSRRRGAQ